MSKHIDTETISQSILKQAMLLFAEKGYQGLSMRQLAKALKLTTGALYHHFRSKDELYTEMIHQLAAQDAEALYRLAAKAASNSEKIARFSAFLEGRAEYFQQILLLVFDHQRYVRDPDNAPEARFARIFEQTLNVYLQALIDVLGLPSKQEAEMVLDYLMGCFIRAMMTQHEPDFSQLPRIMKPLLMQANTIGNQEN
ncbi:MAG: TetR/AcrR family transcriptional regulator [Candidatus Sericytochromatia bacterium]|nr:TetR/AcrR family transcriptional regulator [Candidatus Sericytochromatia bacterium]